MRTETPVAPEKHRCSRVLIALVLLLTTAVIASAVGIRTIAKQTGLQSGQLQLASANTLTMSQELEDVFLEFVKAGTFNGELTESSKQILQTWVKYDKLFLTQNRSNEAMRVERATTHRRVGYGLYALKQHAEAADHFRSAVTLLEQLSSENPMTLCFLDEAADTYFQLGKTLHELGALQESATAERRAAEILQHNLTDYLSEQELNLRLVGVYESLASLSVQGGEPQEAVDSLSDVIAIYERLYSDFPQDVTFARALCNTSLELSTLLQRLGRHQDAAAARASALTRIDRAVRQFPEDDRLRELLARLRTPVVVTPPKDR